MCTHSFLFFIFSFRRGHIGLAHRQCFRNIGHSPNIEAHIYGEPYANCMKGLKKKENVAIFGGKNVKCSHIYTAPHYCSRELGRALKNNSSSLSDL